MNNQIVISNAKGLHTQANSFSQVPDGSYEMALNVVVSSDGIMKKCRGYSELTAAASLTTPTALIPYLSYVLLCHNNTLVSVNQTSGALSSSLGALVPEGSYKTRYSGANGNLYLTSSTGIKKLESPTSTLLSAGIARALDSQVTTSVRTSTQIAIFEPDTQIGYRVLFGRRDANSNLVLGSPSEFAVATNSIVAASSVSGVGSTLTVNTSAAHGQSGTFLAKLVNVTGLSGVDGDYTATVTSATQFTVTLASASSVTSLQWGAYSQPSLAFSVPSVLTTENIYQIYRTQGSVSDDTLPDESTLQLLYEANLTAGNISAGSITFVDDVPDDLRGAFLYTNPSTGSGIASANEEPPFARDIAAFKGSMFYADFQTKYIKTINLISTQAGDLDVNDYVTVTSGATTRTYTAKTVEALNTAGGGEFKLTVSGATTVASAIDATARSLVKVINRDVSATVYAIYTSTSDGVPGQITLVSKSFATNFNVQANDQAAAESFSPTLGYSVGTASNVIGDNTTRRNGIYFSKTGEPEAVPLAQFFEVGSKSEPILRIVPLRDSLIIIKTDGVYRVNGDAGDFVVTTLDQTIICKAADSVATLNNQVYFVSNQGVVAVSDSGATVVSRNIETSLTAVIGKSYFEAQTNAVGYESERLYLLSTVSPSETTADTVYVYNAATSAWTTWDTVFKDALVEPSTDILYYINSSSALQKERKTQTKLDYCGQDYAVSIVAVASDRMSAELSIVGTTATVGDVVVVDDIISRIVDIVTVSGISTYYFAATVNFDVSDTGRIYKAITSRLTTSPVTAGDVSKMKQFPEVQIHFRNRSCSALTVSYYSDSLLGSSTQPWTSYIQADGWGSQPWGLFPWGEAEGTDLILGTQANQPLRLWTPVEVQRSSWIQLRMTHSRAAEPFEIQALVFTVRPYSTRVNR